MKVEVLGKGCAKCNELEKRTRQALEELGQCAEVVKVEDMKTITGYGIMFTPALAVDGDVRVSGKLPSVEELKEILSR